MYPIINMVLIDAEILCFYIALRLCYLGCGMITLVQVINLSLAVPVLVPCGPKDKGILQ